VPSNKIPPRLRSKNLGGFTSASSGDPPSWLSPEGLSYERSWQDFLELTRFYNAINSNKVNTGFTRYFLPRKLGMAL